MRLGKDAAAGDVSQVMLVVTSTVTVEALSTSL